MPLARLRRLSRKNKARLVVYPALIGSLVGYVVYCTSMPGKSFRGAFPAYDDRQRALAQRLRAAATSSSSAPTTTRPSSPPAPTTMRAASPRCSRSRALSPGTSPRARVDWSDHWSSRRQGWPAAMITDTAIFRNPNYHAGSDRPDTLDYERRARVTEGLVAVVKALGR